MFFMKSRSMEKYYRCLVKGNLSQKQLLKGYLLKDDRENAVSIFQNGAPNRKYIETEYNPVERFGDYTLLEVHLITGRSHQIRAHLASIGHPVAGDEKYGDHNWNLTLKKKYGIRGQMLHAYRLEFPDGRIVTAPVPESFERLTGVDRKIFQREYEQR